MKAFIKDRETDWRFTGIACLVYLAFLIWMQAHHEMWRDEVHSWTLSRLAHGFGDLVTGDRRYEGHPPLWFWYLHVWSWFIKPAWGIQVATVAAAMTGAVFMLRYAPFPRYLKVFILASYFFGYEYAVLSRNYSLGWPLLCLFCAAYHPLRPRPLLLAVLLSLLSLTSVYGLMMSIGLMLFVIVDQLRPAVLRGLGGLSLAVSPRLVAALALVAASVVFCVIVIRPLDPNPFDPGWHLEALNSAAIREMLPRFVGGYVPLRQFSLLFWFQEVWERVPAVLPFLGGGLLLLAVASLHGSWRVLLMYLATMTMMAVFQQVRFGAGPRHLGHFFMFFVAACWLLATMAPRRTHRMSIAVMVIMLAFQVEGLVVATVQDTRHTFSGARETAAFIRREELQDLPLVAGPAWFVVSVTGYLRRPFVAVETEEVHETVVFHNRRRGFTGEQLMSRERRSPVLVVTWVNALPPPPPNVASQVLFSSRPSTVPDETFSVYKVEAIE